jgi:membrane protease YdiL (CAAX protease family)/GNAT superfamily N-acetyltransferase
MHIRPATAADAAAIAALVNRAYRPAGDSRGWTHEAHLVAGDRISDAGVRELLVAGSVVLVACEADAIVACVHVESRGAAAYIGMLTTEPARQACGLGKRMLAEAERWAHKHFKSRTFNMSVLERRTDLLAYYERRGYRPTGESEAFHAQCGVGELREPGLRVLALAKRAPPWWRRAVHSRAASLPLGVLCVLGPVLLLQALLGALHLPRPWAPLIVLGACGAAGLAGYALFTKYIEQRRAEELATARLGRELLAGLALGAGLFCAVIGVLALGGHYRFLGHGPPTALLLSLGLAIYSGIVEELLFRGLVFRLIERSWGTWIALACSAIPFGIIHMVNPHATVAGAVAIIFEAGILLGAAYLYTRRLWLPMGLHAAWNFTQSGVFGIVVSGNDFEGWGHSELTGPDWLTGGSFGAEGSIVALVVCTVAGLLLLRAAHARGRFLSYAGQRALARS